jgi:hypothetical protein
MKIQQHTDLEVYKKAFDVAMLIFGHREFSKRAASLVRSGVLRVLSVQIWLKLGGSIGIDALFPNYPMPAKLPKPRSGSSAMKCGYLNEIRASAI